jgi:2-oxoisovalerate dehydrogenase E1 component
MPSALRGSTGRRNMRPSMTTLTTNDKLDILRTMLRSRLGDLREQSLIRQGKGVFHVSGMGHEALCAIGRQMKPQDYAALYYRDRSLRCRRDDELRDCSEFYAKRGSPSADARSRPLQQPQPQHLEPAQPGGGNFLPACGIAWGSRWTARVGWCWHVAETRRRARATFTRPRHVEGIHLPIIFLIEDNGLGISSPTELTTPKGLRLLKSTRGSSSTAATSRPYMPPARRRWSTCVRARALLHRAPRAHQQPLQRRRPAQVPAAPSNSTHWPSAAPLDPQARLLDEGVLSEQQYEALQQEIEAEVRADYQRAQAEPDRRPRT